MKHVFETLQHIVIFHVCLFYEMNSVQLTLVKHVQLTLVKHG